MCDARFCKKHRRLYRERIRATPRWDYYAIVLALLASGIALACGALKLSFLLLVLWFGLTATFSAQRLRGTSRSPRHVLEIVVTSIAIPPLAVFWRLVGALKFRVAFP